MDRRIVYAGAVPVDLDWLEPQRNTELALGYLMQAAFGTSTVIDGLAVTQQTSPNMTVQVGAGSIITYTTVDPASIAYGALPLDTSNLVKVGINTAPVSMSALTAPGVSGQSQNWLLEAKFLEADGSPVVLPYYNAANPSLPYTGPANNGTSQNTRRTNTVQLQWKAGTAAATGQQNTPTPDSGWVGVAIVTVANGQSSILNANIAPYSAAPFVPTKLPQQRKQLTANTTIYVSTFGNDTNNSGLSASSPFLTLQKAWNYIIGSLDLNGFSVIVSIANGTYTGALRAQGSVQGLGSGNSVTFLGNTGSPSSVLISTTNAYCISVSNGASINVSGMKFTASGSDSGNNSGAIVVAGGALGLTGTVDFGAVAGNHLWAGTGGFISASGVSYTISGGAATHINGAGGGGTVSISSGTITVTGTPAFSSAFCFTSGASYVYMPSLTFSGSATGTRYNASLNGVISTNLAGSTYFPGSISGATATGGQYA